jgi:hypothetical protein
MHFVKRQQNVDWMHCVLHLFVAKCESLDYKIFWDYCGKWWKIDHTSGWSIISVGITGTKLCRWWGIQSNGKQMVNNSRKCSQSPILWYLSRFETLLVRFHIDVYMHCWKRLLKQCTWSSQVHYHTYTITDLSQFYYNIPISQLIYRSFISFNTYNCPCA